MDEQVRRVAERPVDGYLTTFKYYDSKKRRLSIFGRVIEGKLEITVLTLSQTPEVRKKYFKGTNQVRAQELVFDIFSKKAGRKKYERECIHGKKCPGRVLTVDIIDDRPRYTFLKWCSENFYRPQKVMVESVKFVRGTKFVHPEKKKANEDTSKEAV